MKKLTLKPHHKPVRDYYATLKAYAARDIKHEGAVSTPFQALLHACAKQVEATLVPQYAIRTETGTRIVIDGMLLDAYGLPIAACEFKDVDDDLPKAVQEKFAVGYPDDNIFFQTPERGILYQNGRKVLDADLGAPGQLCDALEKLFANPHTALENWHAAVAEFKEKVPALGAELTQRIAAERETNAAYRDAFADFYAHCRASINPNLSQAAVEEMLTQHILTERTFRTVFANPDFTRRNIIAREIENVIDALTSQAFSRHEFLESLDPFYLAIEQASLLCRDFSQKQHFLNTVYEQFFQGFSVAVADTHGIVYTPQPLVDFMVKSVNYVLQSEFGKTVSDSGVHLIDAFVGTGNFIVRLMREIEGRALKRKYREELHCNEVLLLPYYIASMNIEHEYFQATQSYLPFEKICLVDTFDTFDVRDAPNQTGQFAYFSQANTLRVEEQKATPMFVVIGNPPYNAGQKNENDNNPNRKYEGVDARVRDTYAKDSAAQRKGALYDPYVKSYRWGTDKLGIEGIVAFVTNRSFIDGIAFDGMRKHLAQDFDTLYVLDLGGNIRAGDPGPSNVFGIQVGVCIAILVKKRDASQKPARILYHGETAKWDASRKMDWLNEREHVGHLTWQQITPDARHSWLTEGLRDEFNTFLPIGNKTVKATKGEGIGAMFKTYSVGLRTNRDEWAINFNKSALTENLSRMMEFYNAEVGRWERRIDKDISVNDFVDNDRTKVKWTRSLLSKLRNGNLAVFSPEKVRTSLYRPFTKSHLYFDRMMNECVYVMPSIFPTPDTEKENRAICVSGIGSGRPFQTLMTTLIPFDDTLEKTQCFPFYTYAEDGSERRENITDWALAAFRAHYGDENITKWDIFNYTYGLLHHPAYRETYADNLKLDLPHIPFAPDFWGFAEAGAQLAELHVNYESSPEYAGLQPIENRELPIDYRVAKKMKFSADKTALRYNDFLTIGGIPSAAFAYRLGASSALEWVVNQYHVKTHKRSQLLSDPNRVDDDEYIVRLIGQVVEVSVRTVGIIGGLPDLF